MKNTTKKKNRPNSSRSSSSTSFFPTFKTLSNAGPALPFSAPEISVIQNKKIANLLDQPETNPSQITAKLKALLDLRDQHGATGNETENRVNQVIAALQPKQAIIEALNLPENNAGKRTTKLTTLQNIQTNYPAGTPEQQEAWKFNKKPVSKAIQSLEAKIKLADQIYTAKSIFAKEEKELNKLEARFKESWRMVFDDYSRKHDIGVLYSEINS